MCFTVVPCNISSALVMGDPFDAEGSIFHLSQEELDFFVSSHSWSPLKVSTLLNSVVIGGVNLSSFDFHVVSSKSINITGSVYVRKVSIGDSTWFAPQVCVAALEI